MSSFRERGVGRWQPHRRLIAGDDWIVGPGTPERLRVLCARRRAVRAI